MDTNVNVEVPEASAVNYRFCPICAGQMYWVESLTMVPGVAGFECEECFFFEFT